MDKGNNFIFSLVIILSGLILAGGIVVYRDNLLEKIRPAEEKKTESVEQIQPISEDDYIIGSPEANTIVIEYADFECPFCKEFHNTMRLIIDRYGSDKKIAWVYRHSPLQGEGSNSMRLALTSECVGKIYGKSKFWQFANEIYNDSPRSLEEIGTERIIKKIGADSEQIRNCIDDSEIIEKVKADIADRDYLASKDQDFGTPYNIIINQSDSEPLIISGSIPYILLDEIIKQSSI